MISKKKIDSFFPDLILLYGWSWKVDCQIIKKYKCLLLHPSDLPKFRGNTKSNHKRSKVQRLQFS